MIHPQVLSSVVVGIDGSRSASLYLALPTMLNSSEPAGIGASGAA